MPSRALTSWPSGSSATRVLLFGAVAVAIGLAFAFTVARAQAAPGITVTPTSGLVTTEAGGTASFTVVLDSEPTADVTVPISSSSSSDTTEGTVPTVDLIFTAANWDMPQEVTVTGVDDDVDDGDVAYTIAIDAATSDDGDYDGIDPEDVSATNTDDDTAGITVTPTSGLVTTEAGGTASFTVVLDSEPTADVTIVVGSSDVTEGTVSTAALTFTPPNWATPQTVTVTGVDDALDDGDIAYTILTSAATSGDNDYNGMNLAVVAVTNLDDDGPGITVTPTSDLVTTEGGGAASFTVVLDSAPTANVTIVVVSSDVTEGTVSTAALTFTPGNWATPQTVVVTGVDDALDDGNIAYTILTGSTVSGDATFNGINPADVAVTNLDDDVVSPGVDGGVTQAQKVTICHIPPGNPGNAHTLTIGAPAVATHVAEHGDTLGACASVVIVSSQQQPGGSSSSANVNRGNAAQLAQRLRAECSGEDELSQSSVGALKSALAADGVDLAVIEALLDAGNCTQIALDLDVS